TMSSLSTSEIVFYFYCDTAADYVFYIFFFFNDPATTEIYTLSLHDALPISVDWLKVSLIAGLTFLIIGLLLLVPIAWVSAGYGQDRKSTRLNSSHRTISYAVFCLKKKK